MQVILYQDVPNLGRAGEIVKVKEGYGRNYLVPRKLAVIANPANIKELEHQKRIVSAKQAKLKKHAEEIASKMKDLSLTIAREAGEEEKLFGSVTSKDIIAALRNEGFIIDRRDLQLEAPIKQIGIYDIPVRLHAEVTGTVKVWVVKK
ncbi:MAG TPA: 50S ribosomal protein L9 [bacterium]|nr:50S ribosomal protein L9 [Myxococcales bacterium]OQA59344.1 MAG: 50S ribosomal protein L9 [bacterium ADurb.Bin270]HPW44750.1 50S ribosomal protein L9 [bacterium]HQC50181.1 50S ribosomal protein L9 [bacterium]HQG13182.1 50S ribosomal protein L9 [bacterium]